ncbi:MAG: transcription elongation factor Spt5 [Candidatus Kariarchaeaceae archaeon]|jgi:transcriptional antiterminator NusG
MPIYCFRAKMGQEKALATMSELKGSREGSGISAILISDMMTGYCFVEGESQIKVESFAAEVKSLSNRAILDREVPIEELEGQLNPVPSIQGLEEGDLVEIVDGPFKGLKARVIRLEDGAQEVTLELLDSTMALPVRLHADYCKKIGSAN